MQRNTQKTRQKTREKQQTRERPSRRAQTKNSTQENPPGWESVSMADIIKHDQEASAAKDERKKELHRQRQRAYRARQKEKERLALAKKQEKNNPQQSLPDLTPDNIDLLNIDHIDALIEVDQIISAAKEAREKLPLALIEQEKIPAYSSEHPQQIAPQLRYHYYYAHPTPTTQPTQQKAALREKLEAKAARQPQAEENHAGVQAAPQQQAEPEVQYHSSWLSLLEAEQNDVERDKAMARAAKASASTKTSAQGLAANGYRAGREMRMFQHNDPVPNGPIQYTQFKPRKP
jgi:hypothetical protein